MKQYFIKFLPEQGKIKDKSFVLDISRNKVGYITYPDNADGIYHIDFLDGTSGGSDHFDLVKLFLCSKSIQAGDLVMYLDEGKEWKSGITDIGYDGDGSKVLKVVGPISEAALPFVKEGMEFDRSEIKIFKYADSYDSKLITEMLGEKWEHKEDQIITPGKVVYVKIKGADGKFY